MEVILLQDVENLGSKNDLVKVRPGYARNYLIPKGLAVVANETNRKIREEKIKQDKRREEKLMSQLQEIVDKLKSTVLRIGAKAGTTEKIFGSVTPHHIADAIKKETGFKIDRRQITLEEEVKTLGTYTAKVKLHEDVEVNVTFDVYAE